MDTWATSSLSPQIATGWVDDPDLFARTFPMDLRPQAHDIIRTWLFYTVVRSHYEHDALPWANAAISGFIVDPDRKKLSKSAANAPDDPAELIARYGADGVRYWAANGRPGMDVVFDEGQLKIGRKLAIKLLNASKFALGPRVHDGRRGHRAARPVDAGRAGRPRRRGHRRLRPLRLRPGHRAHRGLLLVVLRRLRRAGEEPGVRRRRRRRGGVGPHRAGPGAAHAARAVRPVPAVRHRGGVVVVAGGLGPPVAVALGRRPPRGRRRRRRRLARRRARPGGPGRRRRRPRRGPRGQERGQAVDAHRGHRRSSSPTRPSGWRCWRWPKTTSARPGASARSTMVPGEPFSVTVELAPEPEG